ncbi:hypothetical protein V2J09_022196 [Rumex salicifolius]
MKSIWEMNHEGFKQCQFCSKLNALKASLRLQNKNHFSHISNRAKAANEELKEAQEQHLSDPASEHWQRLVINKRIVANRLARAEYLFYAQLAKFTFTLQSYRCSKFFHGLVKRRAKRNHIARMETMGRSPVSKMRWLLSLSSLASTQLGVALLSASPSLKQRGSLLLLWNTARMARHDIGKLKDKGGLGLKNLMHWHLAFMTKTLWDMHCSRHSIWVGWLYHQFLQNGDVLHWSAHARDLVLNKAGMIEGAIVSSLAQQVWDSSIMPKHAFIL